MVDYSRFDRIGDECSGDDSDLPELKGGSDEVRGSNEGCEGGQTGVRRIGKMTSKAPDGRIKFEHQGRSVYEWEQSLDDVNIFITAPPGARSHDIACTITRCRVTLGIKGNPPFIDEPTGGGVIVEESTWTLDEDGEITIILQKSEKGATWDAALSGGGGQGIVDPFTKREMQKKIMLERFQEEAEFNGEAPDARKFMGGVSYT